MGCGKSKPEQVATGNTHLRRKQSSNAGDINKSKSINDIDTSHVTTHGTSKNDNIDDNLAISTNSTWQPQQEVLPQQPNKEHSQKVEELLGGGPVFDDKDVKEINENTKTQKEDDEIQKGGEKDDGSNVNEEQGSVVEVKENLIESSERLVSKEISTNINDLSTPHKIEEIITEGLSGKSEYNTPRHGVAVKAHDLLAESLIKAAALENALQEKTVLAEKSKAEIENGM